MSMPTVDDSELRGLLTQYLLLNDVSSETEDWYWRVVSVFATWRCRNARGEPISSDLLSRFLRDKQRAGLSSYYCRSLRNGLIAVTGELVDSRKVRSIKLPKLSPLTWCPDKVRRLILHVAILPLRKRIYYTKIIGFAFHSGLSQVDIHRVTAADIDLTGVLRFRRRKTDSAVVVAIPQDILAGLPRIGPLFPRLVSNEQFRRDFKRIVLAAGLTGTFKTLRKTSGTEADILTGRGHEHLGNTRAVFEKHYLNRERALRQPVNLPSIG